MPGLGERFRAAREARGLTLSDVAEQIRIRSVYLAAIEEENWSTIGAPVYIRGFLRTYARFLGLDPEEVVVEFSRRGAEPATSPSGEKPEAVTPRAEPAPRFGVGRASPPASLLVWVVGAIAVALIAFVVYNELAVREQPSIPSQVTAAMPSATPSAVPSAAAVSTTTAPSAATSPSAAPSPSSAPPDGRNSLALVLSATSWLRVTVDGSVSMEGTFPAGTAKTFHGKTASVRIGNAGGVDVFVDGKNLGKLGKSGDVVERSFTL